MSSHHSFSLDSAHPPADVAGEFDIAMQVLMQREAQAYQPLRDRLRDCLPALSTQAMDALLKRCRAATQQGIALALRVQSRILTRREASLALYDQFPGLTRRTSERIIGDSISRLSTTHSSSALPLLGMG